MFPLPTRARIKVYPPPPWARIPMFCDLHGLVLNVYLLAPWGRVNDFPLPPRARWARSQVFPLPPWARTVVFPLPP